MLMGVIYRNDKAQAKEHRVDLKDDLKTIGDNIFNIQTSVVGIEKGKADHDWVRDEIEKEVGAQAQQCQASIEGTMNKHLLKHKHEEK